MKTKVVAILMLMMGWKSLTFAQNENLLIGEFADLTVKNGNSIGKSGNEQINASVIPSIADTPVYKVHSIANINYADSNYIPPERYKTRLPQALVVPGILIVYGLSSMGNHGLYSSHHARTELLNFTKGKGGPVDDYLIFAPYAEFGALLLFKVKCRNDFVNTTLLIAKSEVLMLALVYPLKYITKEEGRTAINWG